MAISATIKNVEPRRADCKKKGNNANREAISERRFLRIDIYFWQLPSFLYSFCHAIGVSMRFFQHARVTVLKISP